MHENPYLPTAEPAQLQPPPATQAEAAAFRAIATTQRRILINVILHLACVVLAATVDRNAWTQIALAYGGLILTWCTGTFLHAALAFRVESREVAILFSILAAVPIAGFFVVLRTHQRANTLLLRHGVDVSFWGARPPHGSPAA